MLSGPPCLEATIARESVSQNRYVPPAFLTETSSIASSRRPPDVMREARGGQYQSPGFSITGGLSGNVSSPENTFIFIRLLFSLGLSSTNRPYEPLLARIFSQ